jgi:hypothetical protein
MIGTIKVARMEESAGSRLIVNLWRWTLLARRRDSGRDRMMAGPSSRNEHGWMDVRCWLSSGNGNEGKEHAVGDRQDRMTKGSNMIAWIESESSGRDFCEQIA